MTDAEQPSTTDAKRIQWRARIFATFGAHSFAKRPRGGLRDLLDAIERKHLEDPRFSKVQPPLPDFPALPLDERWVELRIRPTGSPFSTSLARSIGTGLGPSAASKPVMRVLAEGAGFLMIGDPGAGKSTLLKWAARASIVEQIPTGTIPLMVSLASFGRSRQCSQPAGIYEYTWSNELGLPPMQASAFVEFMHDVEAEGSRLSSMFRFFLDGWDEVQQGVRKEIREQVRRIDSFYPYLVSSRPSGAAHVLELPSSRTYDLVPLAFEAMRELMTEWLHLRGRSDLEEPLCAHLDRHIGLRDLASNPFVLTLLCAVAAVRGEVDAALPATRHELYQETIKLFAEYCTVEKDIHFGVDELRDSENRSFELLDRDVEAPYEFRLEEASSGGPSSSDLAPIWESARLITAVNPHERTFCFVHATLQEYLAGQEIGRRMLQGRLNPQDLLHDGLWVQPLMFAFGGLPFADARPVWRALAQSCVTADRYGVLLLRIAPMVAEMGVQDGGLDLLGLDLRQELWTRFLDAPIPRPYARALVELGPEAVVAMAIQHAQDERLEMIRLMMLRELVPPRTPNAGELIRLALSKGAGGAETVIIESEEGQGLDVDFGFRPVEASNLTTAKSRLSTTDVLAKLAQGVDGARRRALLLRLGMMRREEAEDALIEQLHRADSDETEGEILEALGAMGTFRARDELIQRLVQKGPHDPQIGGLMKALRGLPIHHGVREILEVAQDSEHSPESRAAATAALGLAIQQDAIEGLHALASLDEPEAVVRIEALRALALSGSATFVRRLMREEQGRSDPQEVLAKWGYLGAAAAGSTQALGYASELALIESLFLGELHSEDPAQAAIMHSGAVAQSTAVRDALIGLLERNDLEDSKRKSACDVLGALGDPAAVPALTTVGEQAVETESAGLAAAAAYALARVDLDGVPLAWGKVADRARWRVCLERGVLLPPEEPGASVDAALEPSSELKPLPQIENEVWQALDGHIMTARELSEEILGSDAEWENMRAAIRRLRRKGYEIEVIRRRGFFRPDSPPEN